MKHQPRKRFGQNFLVDTGVIAAIVAAIRPVHADRIVEIGPGLGALTRPLLAAVEQMHAIEIDRDLAATLKREFAPRLTVHATDVLGFDFATLGNGLRVVGNLPYNISTPLLFHIARYCAHIRDIHVMLQKEIVERMVAAPADSNHGRLSVMLQYRFELEKLIDVPAEAFDPAPKIESALVRLTPLRPLPFAARDDCGKRRHRPIDLRDRREVAEKPSFEARIIHQARKKPEARDIRTGGAAIEIAVFSHRGAMRNHHAHAVFQRAPQPQRIAKLRIGGIDCALHAAVRDERYIEPGERRVERIAARRRRIDPHCRRQPFDRTGPVARGFGVIQPSPMTPLWNM